jgi:CelD/BcsL family acetyltransferase involved in cellulose biosynthesis
MNIVVIKDTEGFRLLRERWTALHAGTRQASIFNTWEWLYHWWLNYGKGTELKLVTVVDNGDVVAILPLHVRKRTIFRFIPVRMLTFIGIGGDTSPDYLGPIMQGGREKELAAVLASYLAGCNDYSVLHLTDLPVGHDFMDALGRTFRDKGRRVYQNISSRIAIVRLPESWDAFLKGLSGSRRYNIQRPLKKIERDLDIKFHYVTGKDAVNRTIDDLVRLHQSRWADRDTNHAFSSPEYIAFHTSIIHECRERGWLRLYCLEAGGKVIGVRYCYRFRGEVLEFQSGFDPDYADYSPGRVITAYILKNAMEEGDTAYDFLKGEYGHKDVWANDYRETRSLTVYGNSPASRAARLRKVHMPALKAMILRVVRKNRVAN